MSVMMAEWRDRLRWWTRTLIKELYTPLGELEFEGFTTMEHLPLRQAMQTPMQPVPAGTVWGHNFEYMWLRTRIELDERAEGERIVLALAPGYEATLFVNGAPFGTYRTRGIPVAHHYIPDNFLTTAAIPGQCYDLAMEVYAGQFYPTSAPGPVRPGDWQDPYPQGGRVTLGKSTYGIWNEDAYQLYMDVETLTRLLNVLPAHSLRADKVAEALERFTLMVDFEQPQQARNADYRAAHEMLQQGVLSAHNGTTAPQFYGIGNAHLDLAWLWPQAETHRKTARTFAAQLRLLEQYPGYKFLQSQPASYEMCRQHYPELFEKVREAIKKGNWIADGAMYVEPDTNMSSGEALIRQLVHGKRYYRDVLGVESELLWLPDTFGYSAALPQILQGCGVKYLVTQKIFWSYNEGEQFPYHYFTWRGMDGSEVTSFLPTSYTYRTDPEQLQEVWEKRVQTRGLDTFLLPFGYGDGGGGPSRDYLEFLRREEDLEGMPRIQVQSPVEYFRMMEERGGPTETYSGELYFTAHRGVYTSQAKTKNNNRRSELALREAELWGSLAAWQQGAQYPAARMDALWKVLLLHQFHDILPGSSIGRVYEEADVAYADLLKQADEVVCDALAALAHGEGVTVFNSLPRARKALVPLGEAYAHGAVTAEGVPVPVQAAQGGVLAQVQVPAAGAVSLLPAQKAAAYTPATATLCGEGAVLENEHIRVAFNAQGGIDSYVDKHTGREFAAGEMNALRMFKDVPRVFDAWDIDSHYVEQEIELTGPSTLQVAEAGGLRAALKLTRVIENSTLEQIISLQSDATRVEFATTVNWNELHRLLKVSFPVDVQAQEGINEIQFGYMRRPTHRSRQYDKDRYEVCNHRYTALCDNSHGAAVLNDSKYGVGMRDNAIELTLLRAAGGPEMRADNGVQTFTYAFTAWEGDFAHSDVVWQGYELNVPVQVRQGCVNTFSAFRVEADNVVLETVKPAEDGSGDLILRLYESKQADTFTRLHTMLPVGQAWLCDMLENKQQSLDVCDGALDVHFKPFQVHTVRIAR